MTHPRLAPVQALAMLAMLGIPGAAPPRDPSRRHNIFRLTSATGDIVDDADPRDGGAGTYVCVACQTETEIGPPHTWHKRLDWQARHRRCLAGATVAPARVGTPAPAAGFSPPPRPEPRELSAASQAHLSAAAEKRRRRAERNQRNAAAGRRSP